MSLSPMYAEDISIHSLRMEGDRDIYDSTNAPVISIHSLRMEGDVLILKYVDTISNFNPLPPHGGRRNQKKMQLQAFYFNPLPPHGGRLTRLLYGYFKRYFNPLPPHGGRLSPMCILSMASLISIHSLRMEGD